MKEEEKTVGRVISGKSDGKDDSVHSTLVLCSDPSVSGHRADGIPLK